MQQRHERGGYGTTASCLWRSVSANGLHSNINLTTDRSFSAVSMSGIGVFNVEKDHLLSDPCVCFVFNRVYRQRDVRLLSFFMEASPLANGC